MSDAGEVASPERVANKPNDRYSRQELFAPLGHEGQLKLQRGHVAIVGCGATGAAAAGLLARAGVGTLTILDRDFVEPSNLQRQMLFIEEDAAESLPKAEAARRRIAAINRDVTVHAHIVDLVPGNVHDLLAPAQIVLDGTDNFETRFLLNDYAVEQGKPWLYAAAIGSYAATMTVRPGITACLACLFPEPPQGTVETCDTAGILNTAVNLVASLQVTETLKLLVGAMAALRTTLWSMDLWSGEQSQISTAHPRPGCAVCGQRNFAYLRGEARPHVTLCGRNSVQIHEYRRPINLEELAGRLHPHGEVRFNALMLRFVAEGFSLSVFPDGRTVVQGTDDPVRARTLYARYIGS